MTNQKYSGKKKTEQPHQRSKGVFPKEDKSCLETDLLDSEDLSKIQN